MKIAENSLKENLTIPNLLSCLRLAVIVPLVMFIIEENYIWAGIMLLISGVSDMFDGMIARRFNQVTQLGKILDPIADKLTLIAVVVSLSVADRAVLCFALVLFVKEMLMLIGGYIMLKKDVRPPASKWYGKTSTVIFYVSVAVIVLVRLIFGIISYPLTIVLFSITTAAMMFSLIMYSRYFLDMIRRKKHISGADDDKENK